MSAPRLPLLALVLAMCASWWLPARVKAQSAPPIEWQKCLGGGDSDDGSSVKQTSDNGYIISGVVNSSDGDVTSHHGASDFWVVKLDASGVLQWQKTLGGTGDEVAQEVVQTGDGGYAVAGLTWSNDGDVSGNHGENDYWVVKLDPSGNIEWQRTLGGSAQDAAYGLQPSPDGGVVVVGSAFSNDGDVSGNHGNSDLWVVKLDALGELQWQHALGGSALEGRGAVVLTGDGGYLVAGSSGSDDGDVSGNHGSSDFWLVRLDALGDIVWQKCFGGSGGDGASSVHRTSDGGYVAAGNTGSDDGDVTGHHGQNDAWVVKTDASGILEWQVALGGSLYDYASWVVEDVDGGFVLAGTARSNNGDVFGIHGYDDQWLVKLDPLGVLLWQVCLGGTSYEVGRGVATTIDGGYIIAGETSSNNGNVSGNHGGADAWVVKLLGGSVGLDMTSAGSADLMIVADPGTGGMIVQCPAPISASELTVYDALGRKVLHRRMTKGAYTIGPDDLPHGFGVVVVASAQGTFSRSLVLE